MSGKLTSVVVSKNFVVKTVAVPPRLGEENDGDGLTETVELKPAGSASIHDAGVVHHLDLHAQFQGPEVEVAVRGRAEGIPDHEEGDVLVSGIFDDLGSRAHSRSERTRERGVALRQSESAKGMRRRSESVGRGGDGVVSPGACE